MSPPREFHRLRVAEVITETAGACSLVLDVPPELTGAFAYRPGQFLTIRVPSDRDGSVARCYSLSSSPHVGELPTITVKRTDGGYASNWIADNLAAGSVLEAFGRAQDAIIEVARSTAQMIEKAGAAARPDRVDVEFGLKFSASGTVIMAGVAGEASLKVTLGYDIAARPTAALAAASDGPPSEPAAGSS